LSWGRGLLVVQNDIQLLDCGKRISLYRDDYVNHKCKFMWQSPSGIDSRKDILHCIAAAVSLPSELDSAIGLYFRQKTVPY
jgi:hypothetical protein